MPRDTCLLTLSRCEPPGARPTPPGHRWPASVTHSASRRMFRRRLWPMNTGKKPLFLVNPEGKTEEQIADEVIEQLRAAGIEVSDSEEQDELDHTAEPNGEPT